MGTASPLHSSNALQGDVARRMHTRHREQKRACLPAVPDLARLPKSCRLAQSATRRGSAAALGKYSAGIVSREGP
eukprot:366142-Chlamydomonas_euryale.AAC.12